MSTEFDKPIKLKPSFAWRTYIGGSRIRQLHGVKNTPDDNFPEEWIMSTVQARNSGRETIVEGISTLDGEKLTLPEFIGQNPEKILGKKHFEKYGTNLGVLVKLIDSAERLTVQVHPTREKAMKLFNSQFGKTECWHIVDGRTINGEEPCIYFGFKEGITRDYWKECFDKQNISAMLDCLHKFKVKTGDTYLIEGGIPHAIGSGCFLVEIQEPTDYTVRTERVTPSGLAVADFMCHQGLGFDKMFDCFEYDGYSAQQVQNRWNIKRNGDRIIGSDNTEMFGLNMIDVAEEKNVLCSDSFSGIYILDGDGSINDTIVKKGDQFFIPANCKGFTVNGNMKYIQYFGPEI